MIEFNHVSFVYDTKGAETQGQESDSLHDINLKIKDGECILFCGKSGCGKTTMTRLVNGLVPNFYHGKLKGEILFDGRNVSKMPMYEIASQVGSVFQNPRTQFFNVDTDSEIAFGVENQAFPQSIIAQRVDCATKDLDIEHLRGRNIFSLSGGEKQKIAFASVYAMNPSVYLLDEPSSNLDMETIEALREHLQLLKAQGKTIIIVEHRIHYLMGIADRIVLFEEGHICNIFSAGEFLNLSDERRRKMGLRTANIGSEVPNVIVPAKNKNRLELKDVTLLYKKQKIVEDINIQIAPGEVVALVGKNGVGKTTFSRAVCGLHKWVSGEFLWNGELVSGKKRQKLSYMVMQDVNYELFAESVEEECSFGIRKLDEELLSRTMEELELFSIKNRHPGTLSGGQKQRVAVAVGQICKKEILVFDEPTSGLDYESMERVAGIVRHLSEQEKIIFVVTHDYEFLCRTCSRMLVFCEGQISRDVNFCDYNADTIKEIFFSSGVDKKEGGSFA